MLTDIEKYFKLKPATVATGLFAKVPFSDRRWEKRPEMKKSIHGVSYSKFAEALDVRLDENFTLFQTFHGCCDTYMSYFMGLHKDDGWKPVALKRESFNPLIHVFAIKTLEDGRVLFADARGITDGTEEFFDDFSFTKNNMCLEPFSAFDLYPEEAAFCKKAYDLVYGEEDPAVLCDTAQKKG